MGGISWNLALTARHLQVAQSQLMWHVAYVVQLGIVRSPLLCCIRCCLVCVCMSISCVSVRDVCESREQPLEVRDSCVWMRCFGLQLPTSSCGEKFKALLTTNLSNDCFSI